MKKIAQNLSKNVIQLIEKTLFSKEQQAYLKVNVGDLVEIGYKIPEGEKERIQIYQGIIIAKKNRNVKKSITIRRKVDGIGLEQIFFLNSPKIFSLKKLETCEIRRSKLYFLRNISRKLNKQEINEEAF